MTSSPLYAGSSRSWRVIGGERFCAQSALPPAGGLVQHPYCDGNFSLTSGLPILSDALKFPTLSTSPAPWRAACPTSPPWPR